MLLLAVSCDEATDVPNTCSIRTAAGFKFSSSVKNSVNIDIN